MLWNDVINVLYLTMLPRIFQNIDDTSEIFFFIYLYKIWKWFTFYVCITYRFLGNSKYRSQTNLESLVDAISVIFFDYAFYVNQCQLINGCFMTALLHIFCLRYSHKTNTMSIDLQLTLYINVNVNHILCHAYVNWKKIVYIKSAPQGVVNVLLVLVS